MTVQTATPSLGFDVNQPLSAAQAAALKASGYSFCIRYVPRSAALTANNITAVEVEAIVGAGLALMIVQHVSQDNWEPTAVLGAAYGQYAAEYTKGAGVPAGVNLWLDLEMVAKDATSANVTAYCKAWFNAVSAAGYVPGLYVGYQPGLTPQELYVLPFQHYWRAYNYDDGVADRGFQMLQEPQQTVHGIIIDPNKIRPDNEGGLPLWLIE